MLYSLLPRCLAAAYSLPAPYRYLWMSPQHVAAIIDVLAPQQPTSRHSSSLSYHKISASSVDNCSALNSVLRNDQTLCVLVISSHNHSIPKLKCALRRPLSNSSPTRCIVLCTTLEYIEHTLFSSCTLKRYTRLEAHNVLGTASNCSEEPPLLVENSLWNVLIYSAVLSSFGLSILCIPPT